MRRATPSGNPGRQGLSRFRSPEPVEGPSATTSPRASRTPPHRRSRESGNPGQGRGAGPSPSRVLPRPEGPSYRRKPVSRGAPGGDTKPASGPAPPTPPPTHIAGALRDSVRPEPVEGPSPTRSPPARRSRTPSVIPAKAGIQRGGVRQPDTASASGTAPPTVVPAKAGTQGRGAARGVSVSRHSCESRYPEVRRAAGIAGAPDSVRRSKGALHHHQPPRSHRSPTVVPALLPHERNPCGNPTQNRKRPAPPTVVLAKAGTQGRGAARGASASRTSHTRHRRTGESRYPEVRRAAARPHPHRRRASTLPRVPHTPSHRRSREPRAGARRGASPPLELPTPATVVPAKAGIQRCAGRGTPPPTCPRVTAPPHRRSPAKAGTQGRGAARGTAPSGLQSRIQKHPDTTPLPPRRPLPYPPPMHHARKHTGHKPTTPRMPRQPAQNASENTQNPLVSDQTSRICRGQFCRRLVSHIAKSPLKQFESSTAEEPPGGRPSPRDAICNKPETNTLRRRATLNAT